MIFRREPFFHGRDNADQLVKIARVLGTDALMAWVEKYGLTLSPSLQALCGRHQPKSYVFHQSFLFCVFRFSCSQPVFCLSFSCSWQRFVTRECAYLVNDGTNRSTHKHNCFCSPNMISVSIEGLEFLSGLLKYDPADRLTGFFFHYDYLSQQPTFLLSQKCF
jgi:hypothetical protein